MRLLVVEDDRDVGLLVSVVLGTAGHDVDVVDDPAALASYDLDVYDGAVVDWMLPGMEGPQVVELLRARRPGLPCVLWTASIRPDVGSVDVPVVEKPSSTDELLEALRRAAGD